MAKVGPDTTRRADEEAKWAVRDSTRKPEAVQSVPTYPSEAVNFNLKTPAAQTRLYKPVNDNEYQGDLG